MDKIMAYAKSNGFVYQGSEIYGGLANSWDYGPNGVELKNNIKSLWWRHFILEDKTMTGIDSAIIMNPKVWEASGHVGNFSDPLIDCKKCNSRFRADKLIEEFDSSVNAETMSFEEMSKYIIENKITCADCGELDYTNIRSFNLMLSTKLGVVEDSMALTYLRPETAQGIFINFKNLIQTTRQKVPFGIGQIGKSFRNEITPGNFIFRTREFEQMEIEYFVNPSESSKHFEEQKEKVLNFLKRINLKDKNYRLREHDIEELAHYSSQTIDIEYKFPFGYGELWGVAHRGDYDLAKHEEHSGVDLKYTDPQTNEKYLPHVIEPSVGVDRLLLAILLDAYEVEELEDGTTREVLKLTPMLAPNQIAVLPLVKKQEEKAEEIYTILSGYFKVTTDSAGKIGKRYRRQDAIGTPFCITVDYDTEENDTVTVRNRDTMEQETIKVEELKKYFFDKIVEDEKTTK